MKNIKLLLKVLLYPMILFFGEFLIEYIFVFLFNQNQMVLLKHNYPKLSNQQIVHKLNDYILSSKYKMHLQAYLNNHSLIIAFIVAVILIPIFILIYKKYRNKAYKIKFNDFIFIVLFGMAVSLIFNITFYWVNNLYHFTNQFTLSEIPLFVQIISSGLIGPILEELVFRGVVYNRLKQNTSNISAIIITSVLFALFHFTNILNVIYAFMMSFLFIYVYSKYHNLRYSILIHSSANITIILMMRVILMNIFWVNILIWAVSLIILVYIYQRIIKKDVYNFK